MRPDPARDCWLLRATIKPLALLLRSQARYGPDGDSRPPLPGLTAKRSAWSMAEDLECIAFRYRRQPPWAGGHQGSLHTWTPYSSASVAKSVITNTLTKLSQRVPLARGIALKPTMRTQTLAHSEPFTPRPQITSCVIVVLNCIGDVVADRFRGGSGGVAEG
jgi:hypothetical protein